MPRTLMFLFALLVVGLVAFLNAGLAGDDPPQAKKVRIGTYDSRAIAIAYAPSRFNPVREKMAAYEKAKAAGDRAKMKELETWGEQHQRLLHFQGFGRVPVTELLEPVKDEVAKLARQRQLTAITMHCDFLGADVEVVDVTDDLVKLYDPSKKALGHIQAIRTAKPVPLTELADLPAKR
jgi:hypothetical protein